MEFEYRIYEEVYNDMLSGKKTIEFRLLNEKSSNIQIGDKIKVIDKYIYDTLEDLWNDKDRLNNSLNYTKEEFINAFNNIFDEENVSKSKIVGLKIKVLY